MLAALLVLALSAAPQEDAIAGEKAYREGRYGEAADHFEKAVQKDAKTAGLWVALGHASIQAGRPDAAIRAYRQAIALKTDTADVNRSLGQAYALKGRHEEAIASFRKAGQLDPEGNDCLSIARLRAQREEWLLAEHEVSLHLRVAPASIEALELLSYVLVRGGKHEQAGEVYRQLSRRKPLESKYLIAWGQAEASRGRYGEASDILEIASRLGEANPETLRLLADLYLQQQMHREAAAAYARMLAASKEPKADDYLRLGHAYARGGETVSARAAFEKARTLDPALTSATLQLAHLAASRGETDVARKEFEAAVQGSTSPSACEALGDFELKAGDSVRAAAAFAEAIRRGGASGSLRYNHALALHTAGKLDDARSALREALRQAPLDERLRALLRQIDK